MKHHLIDKERAQKLELSPDEIPFVVVADEPLFVVAIAEDLLRAKRDLICDSFGLTFYALMRMVIYVDGVGGQWRCVSDDYKRDCSMPEWGSLIDSVRSGSGVVELLKTRAMFLLGLSSKQSLELQSIVFPEHDTDTGEHVAPGEPTEEERGN